MKNRKPRLPGARDGASTVSAKRGAAGASVEARSTPDHSLSQGTGPGQSDPLPMEPMPIRPRRNRRSESIRALVRETELSPAHFILPLFVQEGSNQRTPIRSMPGVERLSRDLIVKEAKRALALGIGSVALFPLIPDGL